MGPLIGRDRESSELARCVEGGAGVISLVGPPGAGKSAIARRWAAEVGARVCDLGPASSPDEIVVLVRASMDAPLDEPGDERRSAERFALALAAEGVLVLDNVEGAARHLAVLVARWLELAPKARLVVTSRQALGLARETVVNVGPLPVEDAVELFLARACAAAPDLDVSAHRSDVERIVRRLDGLPLALELAAARCSVLAPPALLARLDQPLSLRAVRGGRADARFASLEDAIAWSWTLLDAHEQRALAQCAVFAGPFTLAAAEQVLVPAEGAPSVLDTLQSLHARCLLHSHHDAELRDRRVALFGSVRDFVAERGEVSEEVLRRHAEHVLADARDAIAGLDESGRATFAAALARAYPDLVAIARRFAGRDGELAARAELAMAEIHAHEGPLSLATELASRAAASLPADGPPHLHAAADLLLGEAYRRLGSLPRAIEHARAARARVGSDADVAARSLLVEGTALRDLGRFEDAYACADAGIEHARSAGCVSIEGRGELLIASILLQLQEPAAEERAAAALASTRVVESRTDEAKALFVSALVAHDRGALAEASRFYDACAELARDLRDLRLQAYVGMSASIVAAAGGDAARAIEMTRDALACADRVGDLRGRAAASGYLGIYAALSGDQETCRVHVTAARAAVAATDDRLLERFLVLADVASDLARAERAHALGRAAEAEEVLAKARSGLERAAAPAGAPQGSAEPALVDISVDARLVVRLIEPRVRELARAMGEPLPPSSRSPRLEVGADGRWFRVRSAPRVSLAQRPVLASVLQALATERERRPGRGVDPDALFQAAWAGERAVAKARSSRVYVAISTLRKLGLGALLQRSPDGYLFDPAVPFERRPGSP